MKEPQRIMVLDNDREMLKLLDRTLEKEGFDTIIIADSDEALALLDKIKPDMVIMDVTAPGDDDIQTLDLIRKRSNVPVIMLSPKPEVVYLQQALAHGADDYVSKPFSTQLFVARIRAKLRRASRKTGEASFKKQGERGSNQNFPSSAL